MGERLRSLVEDGYRTQLRVAPRSYSVYYWALEHLAPMRWLTKQFLCRLGASSLRREILRRDPDVVVSTYPAITVVLSHLRRRRQIDMPTVATITDMTGLFFWAQRGIDTHLVMYDQSVRDVERIAGRGSAQVVRPLISAEFLEPRERAAARAALGLPAGGHVVVVSGGGWGVGDLEGAVGELAALRDTTVVCVAGRNEPLRERLGERFGEHANVRVLGFTDRMPDLLAAADVLVHSTGGVTCLEAMARGCPVVSYGLPVGHAKLNTKAMAAPRVRAARRLAAPARRARRPRATSRAPRARPARRSARPSMPPPRCCRRRVGCSPIARWRMRPRTSARRCVLTLGAGTWVMSTDELDAFASALVHQVKTRSHRPAGRVRRRPRAAGRRGRGRTAARQRDNLRGVDRDDEPFRAARRCARSASTATSRSRRSATPALLGWIHTSSILRRDARALHLDHRFYYLEPRRRDRRPAAARHGPPAACRCAARSRSTRARRRRRGLPPRRRRRRDADRLAAAPTACSTGSPTRSRRRGSIGLPLSSLAA